MVTNSNGEPELLCNNEGVEFSEAYDDIRLAQVDFHNPDATVEGKIVPPRSPFPDKNNDRVAVFCVQVTNFKCGSVAFDHRVADAHSANMFMVSWAEVCRNQSISSIPTFRRSLLNPRRHPGNTSTIDEMYVTLSSLVAESNNIDPSPPLASRIYYLYAKDIDNLQSVAIQNCPKKYSKLEAFCAYLWRLINISGNNDEDQEEKSGNKVCRMQGSRLKGRTMNTEKLVCSWTFSFVKDTKLTFSFGVKLGKLIFNHGCRQFYRSSCVFIMKKIDKPSWLISHDKQNNIFLSPSVVVSSE
eukprot:Gb_17584 [translate_table: standard]